MKKAISSIILLLLIITSCSKKDEDSTTQPLPEVVNSKVPTIMQSPVQSIKATITKYLYEGQIVYLISTNFPDAPSLVYNEKNELICSIGGIGGNLNS